MGLTREQYNSIMREIDARRNRAYILQSKRQEEVYERIPAIKHLNEDIAGLSRKEFYARIKKDGDSAEKFARERQNVILRRGAALKKAGYSEDYLNVHYSCEMCRDTGFVDNKKCGCFKQLQSKLLNQASGIPNILERKNFGSFDDKIYDGRKPLEEFLPRRISQREYMLGVVLKKVRGYLDNFSADSSSNILMMGPAGTGKTFISCCIAKSLIDRQYSVLYERAGDMFDLFNRFAFAGTGNESVSAGVDQIMRCELLIIDDLGTEFITDFTKSRLFSIISDRFSHDLSTIISTNLSLNQLSSIYGERIASRFIGDYILLPFYGSDLREKKQEED